MCDKACTRDEWNGKVLLLLTGPDGVFKSGDEAIRDVDRALLDKLWEAKWNQYDAADEYRLRHDRLIVDDPRLDELLGRLSAPGKPGEALSASEFEELVIAVEDMRERINKMGRLIHAVRKKTSPDNGIGMAVRGSIPHIRGEDDALAGTNFNMFVKR